MMKRSINHILAFILMLLLSFIIVFIFIQIQLSKNNIITTLDAINYYEKAHENIIEKVNDYIINDDVKKIYSNYITIDIIKEDVNLIIDNIYNKKNYDLTRYDEFYKVINSYNSDKIIDEVYASGINDIYTSNIFPIREFNMISFLFLDVSDILFICVVISLIALVISLILFFINKEFKYHKISVIASSIVIMSPFFIIRITNLFDDFIYTNKYYTTLILSIVLNLIISLFMFALILLIIFLLKYLFDKNNK